MTDDATLTLERTAAALTLREQERLGRQLHDTLGPQITAIGMLAESLLVRLRNSDSAETALAAKLLDRVEQAKLDVRALAKGLMPVEVDAEGLMNALDQLAEETEATHDVVCRFECAQPVAVDDNFAATRLFRIAKEAVHNAVKHGQPHEIVVSLSNDDGLTLRIADDGSGLPANLHDIEGNGVRIMRYRCQLIGGNFDIEPGQDGGAVVTCSINQRDLEDV